MKNIFILVLIVVAIALLAYGWQKSSNNNQNINDSHMEMTDDKTENDSMTNDDKMMGDEQMVKDDVMADDDKMMMATGEYIDYSPELLSRADDGKVVLFFHAAWCPTCKALENSILAGQIPENVTILKIDYDNSSELKKKYAVTTQHTLVQVDSSANEISKWVGGNSLTDIEAKLK